MILPAQSLRKAPPLSPFEHAKVVHRGMSYGCSSAGYDIRIDQGRLMWPLRFCLASSIEQFAMPDDLLGIVCDKSTWARRGIAVQNTVIEPGWRGWLTLELTNHSWRWRRILEGDPIAQVIFYRLEQPTDRPYTTGKYQNQPRRPVPAIDEPQPSLCAVAERGADRRQKMSKTAMRISVLLAELRENAKLQWSCRPHSPLWEYYNERLTKIHDEIMQIVMELEAKLPQNEDAA